MHKTNSFLVSICMKQVLIVKIKCFASVMFNILLMKMTYGS